MTSRRRRWLAAASVGLAMLALAGLAARRWYEPGWRHEVRGVDVSHHQGPIDWPALAADGNVDFAFIKATEGGDWVDPRFAENWAAAAETGLLRGAYHFFTLCRPGVEQAANLIDTVPAEPGTLPPAVDLEFGGNCAARPSAAQFRAELDAFLAAVEAHYGVKPVAYVTREFYDHYLASEPPEVIWWVRSLFWAPGDTPHWTFWQYLPGRRSGVDGDVDRNAFRADLDGLLALTLPGN